jgi:hypothetical protein
VSDAPNGPGWWLASDGKWYPPQPSAPTPAAPTPASYPTPGQPTPTATTPTYSGNPSASPMPTYTPGASQAPPVPGYPAPGAYSPYQAAPQTGGTNGLAIASLVLSLLWICGIGSLVAVVFGIIALSQTKKSGQKGKGLAIAGLVIGSLGLIATVVTTVVVVTSADKIIETSPDERDDVELVSCATEGSRGVAVLKVTNDSSKPSSYIISVQFDDLSGNIGSVPSVEPDETTIIEIRSASDVDSEPTCSVEYVQRFAS